MMAIAARFAAVSLLNNGHCSVVAHNADKASRSESRPRWPRPDFGLGRETLPLLHQIKDEITLLSAGDPFVSLCFISPCIGLRTG